MSTRDTLRQNIGNKLGVLVATGIVASSPSPSATQFSVAALVGRAPADIEGTYVYVSTGTRADQEQSVLSFDSGTQVVTLRVGLTGAPAAADKVEFYRVIRGSEINVELNNVALSVANYFMTHKADRTKRVQASVAAPTLTIVGTAGTTEYQYRVVALRSGVSIAVSDAAVTTTGNATLDSSNKITITWTAVTNATAYDVYRVFGGATTGKIVSATTAVTATDNGIAADSAPEPLADDHWLPSGFSYIRRVSVETDTNVYIEVDAKDWELILVDTVSKLRFTDSAWAEYSPGRIELLGQVRAVGLAADTASTSAPDDYLINAVAALLALKQPVGTADLEGWNMRVNEWKARALEVLAREQVRPWPGSRRVVA